MNPQGEHYCDVLAEERTILAKERNYLSYIRTGFTAVGVGLVLFKFFPEYGWWSIYIGLVFIIGGMIGVLGGLFELFLSVRVHSFRKRMEKWI